jgi:two-component system CheB/CheR fusion protein
MQATNEELETLNEEFQATIEELNTTNDEHEARNRDLQEQLVARDDEQQAVRAQAAALMAIVDESAVAVAAVDAGGAVIAANRLFRELQQSWAESSVLIDDDAGATLSLSVVLRRAGEGQTFAFTYRSIAADQSRSVYAGSARPLGGSAARAVVELTPLPAP